MRGDALDIEWGDQDRLPTTLRSLRQKMRSRGQDAVVCEATRVIVCVELPAMKPAPERFRNP